MWGYFVWLNVRILSIVSHILCQDIVLPGVLEAASCRGLYLEANVTVEVVLHLLGSVF